MTPPLDSVDRIMEVMELAFPVEYGEAWNRRQVSDSLLLAGTHFGLIAPDFLNQKSCTSPRPQPTSQPEYPDLGGRMGARASAGLPKSDATAEPGPDEATAGFYLSRGLFEEEELLLFAVVPNWRRRGLGHALLTQFIENARQRGKKRLFLEMRRNNPAGILYASHGFRPIGIRPRYYRAANGERIDAITQELVLD